MKDDTLLIIGGLAVAGFLIYKSNILQNTGQLVAGLGGVTSGVSTAVQGAGTSVAELTQGASAPAQFVDDWFQSKSDIATDPALEDVKIQRKVEEEQFKLSRDRFLRSQKQLKGI